MKRRVISGLVAIGAALAVGAGLSPHSGLAAGRCVEAREALAHGSGGDGETSSFGPAIFRRTLALEVSLDGAHGAEVPISIEEVCNVPRRLRRQAAQLAGGEGVALLLARTTVWRGDARVPPRAVARALDSADRASLLVRLHQRRHWRVYEDGNAMPTFTTVRITITD